MGTQIRITVAQVSLLGELFDTPCATKIAGKLPIVARPNRWGDEFYFEIPLGADLDNTSTRSVKVGDIGFWPPGQALAIFFGPTPMSDGQDPVPASAVNVVGRISEDATALKAASDTQELRIERVPPSTGKNVRRKP